MERIKTLNYYQKGIIIVMVAMILIFAVIYPKTISRVGYRYNDEILVPNQENGNIVYLNSVNWYTVSGGYTSTLNMIEEVLSAVKA